MNVRCVFVKLDVARYGGTEFTMLTRRRMRSVLQEAPRPRGRARTARERRRRRQRRAQLRVHDTSRLAWLEIIFIFKIPILVILWMQKEMVKVDLSEVVLRRMKEDDLEMVKELIKEGSRGSENRLILHLLTRPLGLLLLAIVSSVLRCILHNFIFALVLPVFVVIIYLKLTIPRSVGILGTSKPYWDYVGSCYRGPRDCTMENPYVQGTKGGAGPKTNVDGGKSKSAEPHDKTRRRQKDKSREMEERESEAGEVWLAVLDEEIVGCISIEGGQSEKVCKICRLVVQCWYRREGIGRLLVHSVERREKEFGRKRVYAHVSVASKLGEAFFRSLGYRMKGEPREGGVEEDELQEEVVEEKGWMGCQLNKVFVKDL
ncbi:N-acetyltransferase 14 [Arapaima gigas]